MVGVSGPLGVASGAGMCGIASGVAVVVRWGVIVQLAFYGTACGQRCLERWWNFNVGKTQGVELFGRWGDSVTHDRQRDLISHLLVLGGGGF